MALATSLARVGEVSGTWGPVLIPRPTAITGETALTADPRSAEAPLQTVDFVDEKSGFRVTADREGTAVAKSRKLAFRRAVSLQVLEQ
jgi:hypothetical protein